MATSSSDNERYSTLSLSEDEVKMPPWQDLLHSGAISRRQVIIKNSDKGQASQNDEIRSPHGYFSDEELSDDEDEEEESGQEDVNLELRNYQLELAEPALRGRNIIIWAPTGSGKTRVATYIIAEHLKEAGERPKRVAFLARTVPLAVQQYKSLRKYLSAYETLLVTGESRDAMTFSSLLTDYHIIVATPMILENHLKWGLLSDLGMFSLLVFDECHHTRKGEPYNTLMTSYIKTKNEISEAIKTGKRLNIQQPQIVGLTASIGIEKADELEIAKQNVLRLCSNLDVCQIAAVERYVEELRVVVPVPREESRRLNPRPNDGAVQRIMEIMRVLEQYLLAHVRVLAHPYLTELVARIPPSRKSQEYEQWVVLMQQNAKSVPLTTTTARQLEMNVRMIVKITEYLLNYRFALETYDLVGLEDILGYLDRSFRDLQSHDRQSEEENSLFDLYSGLRRVVLEQHNPPNDNLRTLVHTIEEFLVHNDATSRGIVFVRTRALAEALVSWFKRCEYQHIRDLKACTFTGSNIPESAGGMTQAKQEQIIEEFRSGRTRLLVATSVAEEGLDIPECNVVIKYNQVGNEVSAVQTRGRTRAAGGVAVLLGMEDVLYRERMNRTRAQLMQQAIEEVRRMDPTRFQAAIQQYQQETLEEILIAEAAQKLKEQTLRVPFQIVCPLCRKITIENTQMRTVLGKYRVCIDRNILSKIRVFPYGQNGGDGQDGLDFLGSVRCKGETTPGKQCWNPLGILVKHKRIPMVSLGIKKIAFHTGHGDQLRQFKQWKKAPFFIEELTQHELISYLREVVVRPGAADRDRNEQSSSDDSSDNED